MRARARELRLADAEVARRAGLTQQRYANYVADRHEPDLETFARLCAALEVTADALLASPVPVPPPPLLLEAALTRLDGDAMAILVAVAEALALRSSIRSPSVPVTRPDWKVSTGEGQKKQSTGQP